MVWLPVCLNYTCTYKEVAKNLQFMTSGRGQNIFEKLVRFRSRISLLNYHTVFQVNVTKTEQNNKRLDSFVCAVYVHTFLPK